MSKSLDKGRKGEEIALNYLIKNGYTLIEKNYHCRYGEIDIIASKCSHDKHVTLEFVEVRTRTINSLNLPEESVTYQKLLRIKRTIGHFLENKFEIAKQNPKITSLRISLIGILLDASEKPIRITHIPIQ